MKSILSYFFIAIFFYPFHSVLFGSFFEPFPDYWTGDTDLFVSSGTGNVIQLNAPEVSGEAFIFTASEAIEDATWEMAFQLDFNPSSSNYFQIFLATDGQKNFQNGFFLVVGTSKDNVSLWERKNGEDRVLIEGREDLLDMDPVIANVRVSRKRGGDWTLETMTGSDWQEEGKIKSDFGFAPNYFGLSCHYTKTRCDKFLFGPLSVSGEAYADTIPPEILSMQVINGHTMEFTFSEEVSIENSEPDLIIENVGALDISEVSFGSNSKEIRLKLPDRLPDVEEAPLSVSGWSDNAGSFMNDTTLELSYLHPKVENVYAESYRDVLLEFNLPLTEGILTSGNFIFPGKQWKVENIEVTDEEKRMLHLDHPLPDAEETGLLISDLLWTNGDTIAEGPYSVYYHEASPYDIVVTEIMHDPAPAAFLPEEEYLELYNRSELPVNLKNMSLSVNGNEVDLPEFLVFPGEYVVLVSQEETNFENALSLNSWPSLTNGGGEVILRNPSEKVVAAFRYPGVLSGKSYKQDGGWAMEVVDVDNLSGSLLNWVYCQNEQGGTPGMENSVNGANPDLLAPMLEDAWFESDSVLKLDFAEPLQMTSVDFEVWKSENSGLSIGSIRLDAIFRDVMTISFGKNLKANVIENLSLQEGIKDLAGNELEPPYELSFGFPGSLDSFDVVINELLFDPPVEGCDFVEIYNRSDKVVSLDSLCLSRNDQNGYPEELTTLSKRTHWLLPGQYLCLAGDAQWVKQQYESAVVQKIREISGFPNFVNDGGTVFLTLLNGKVIDRFDYSPEYHFDLLSETKGVSLERIGFERITNNPLSWHSASSTSGYATPGAPNSQLIHRDKPANVELFELSPEIFTPDLDGANDQLIISYSFEKPGQKGSFIVFDAEGNEIRRLVKNQTLGTSGQITWDGTKSDHSLAPPGIYIIWAQVFDLGGNVKAHKASCVLGVRKN